jgi:hypothetical protein
MPDVAFVALTVAVFTLALGCVAVCARLMR